MNASEVKQLIDVVKRNKGWMDGHNGQRVQPEGWHLVAYNGHICPVKQGTVTCLNPLRLNGEGECQLSTFSIGGNVDLRDGKTIHDGLHQFNLLDELNLNRGAAILVASF